MCAVTAISGKSAGAAQSQEMYRGTERMLRSMEAGDPQDIQEKKSDWMSVCSRFVQYYEALKEGFKGKGSG